MSENTTNDDGQLSFCELFAKYKYRVVIPVIQRDYAQGRDNDKAREIRENFLNSLYSYLDENRPGRNLDFIYGVLAPGDGAEEKNFIPLDGQQRLTTLFLLHWFLHAISSDQEAKAAFERIFYNDAPLDERKSPLTYETRESSRAFCEALVNSGLTPEKNRPISEAITNEPWFFRYWEKDPSIHSMLTMLDAIQKKFSEAADFLPRLLNHQDPIITFNFKDLNKFGLTDDLYIKMNSRDKPLTNYENFKAALIGHIREKIGNPSGRTFMLEMGGQQRVVPLADYFSHSADTRWTDMIWQYCKNGEQGALDRRFGNLIWAIITASRAANPNEDQDNAAIREPFFRPDDKRALTFFNYDRAGMIDAQIVQNLVDSLDALYNAKLDSAGSPQKSLNDNIPPEYHHYCDAEELFKRILDGKASYADRLQFYAFVGYLKEYSHNSPGLGPWLRLIRNLSDTINTMTDSENEFARRIRSIDKLLPHAHDIIGWLAKGGKIDDFSPHQTAEEKIKACFIAANAKWLPAIMLVEKHAYFRGQIGFILKMAGLVDDKYKKPDLALDDRQNAELLALFETYARKAGKIFSGFRNPGWKYCFERAMLTKGDYLPPQPRNWLRRNLLTSTVDDEETLRAWSWRRWLQLGEECEERIGFLKDLLDDERLDMNALPQALEKICMDKTEGWRGVLARQPGLFGLGDLNFWKNLGFLAFDYPILVLSGSRAYSRHVELFSFALWLNEIRDMEIGAYYTDVTSAEYDEPYIGLELKYNGKPYFLCITAETNDVDPWDVGLDAIKLDRFRFEFYKNTQTHKNIKDEGLMEILDGLGFEITDEQSYVAYVKTEKSAGKLARNLHDALTE